VIQQVSLLHDVPSGMTKFSNASLFFQSNIFMVRSRHPGLRVWRLDPVYPHPNEYTDGTPNQKQRQRVRHNETPQRKAYPYIIAKQLLRLTLVGVPWFTLHVTNDSQHFAFGAWLESVWTV
jgi:hypothetical protein